MLTSGMELNPYAVDLGGQDPIPVLMVTAETLFALTRPLSLAQADQALYFAKERGRNRVELANLGMVMERKDAPTIVPTAQSAA